MKNSPAIPAHSVKHSDKVSANEPLLIPTPKCLRVDLSTRHHFTPSVVHATTLPSLSPGGYRLCVRDRRVEISSADDAGARAASATLNQLVFQYGQSLPQLRIEDAPALSNRGIMLDVSRCRVPRTDELFRVSEQFARLKLNHLQLYTEHTFAYRGCDEVWSGSSPLTPSQIMRLDTHCRERGIELAANQNCFGHLTRWLQTDRFRHLAETHNAWDFLGLPRSGPFSLCPTDEGSIHFVKRLLDGLRPCFTSPLVNIGCDETHDVGQGRSRSAVSASSKSKVYGQFVAQVCNLVLERDGCPMIWGDIAADHPEVISMLPPETIGLVWGYESSSDFAHMGRAWQDAGHPWWVCPGTSSWRSYTGRSTDRQHNIRRAAFEGIERQASGMLMTDWGDLGHHQTWPIALMGIAEGADAAWTGKKRHKDFLDAVSLQVFADRSLHTAHWIEQLGDADKHIREISGVRTYPDTPAHLANASALFIELHPSPVDSHLPKGPESWAHTKHTLAGLLRGVPNGAGPLIEDELRHAAQCALIACDIAIYRRRGGGSASKIQIRLEHLKQQHRRLWRIRSRPGGLQESIAFWDSIKIEGSHVG